MATTTTRTALLRLTAGISWASSFRSANAFHVTPNTAAAAAAAAAVVSRGSRSFMTSKEAATSSLTPEALCDRAKDFVNYKNAAGSGESTLDDVFDMCSLDVDLYGLTGDKVRPGFTAFFKSHDGLHHELLEEPTFVGDIGPGAVQYPFIKTWNDDNNGEPQRWSSIDPDKPRNKVERLEFDGDGMLARVSVVDLI